MFHLTVKGPNLDAPWVVALVKSSPLSYSVVCGLWSAVGGLETTVDIGDSLYAYASNSEAELQDGVTISAGTSPLLLSEGNVYRFDGTTFVQEGQTLSDFDYGLCNGRQTPLTCGLCQDVTVNDKSARPPVCVQRLSPEITHFFPTNNLFLLGVGLFSGLRDPQPGLLLSKSLIQAALVPESPSGFGPSLGTFAPVDFSEGTNWVASYQPSSSSFQLQTEPNS
jgi:hypothetical protein